MYKKKKAFNKRVQIIAGLALSLIMLMMFMLAPEAGAGISIATVMVWGSLKEGTFKELTPDQFKELKEEDQTKYLTDLNTYKENRYKEIKAELKTLSDDMRKGDLEKEAFATKFEEITGKLEALDAEKFKAYQKSLEKLEAAMMKQGDEMKALKENPTGKANAGGLRKEIQAIQETPEYKEFVDSNGKKKASFNLKTVSITDDYTGTSQVHITTRDNRVVDHPQVVRLNIRDLLTVMPTDLPYLAFTEVYDWDRAVGVNTENGSLAESSFKVREATVDAKRIGTFVTISNRMIKSAKWVLNHLMQRLPAQVKYYEDFQLLWGDGAGNNVTGIFKVAPDFTTTVNTPIIGAAGSVTSIATYDSGDKTLVTFTANQLLNNGDTITFAATTGTTYDGAHVAKVISPTQFIIEQDFTSDANVLANWTFIVNSPFKESIEAAQQIDVLKVAKTLVTQQEYSANGIVLNPVDATLIETLKDTTEQYLDVKRLENGILTISGIPVVETTAMPAGNFAVGDWAMAAALLEFSSLVLEFSESTDEKLKNQVVAIIQEEVLFPIYNKYMFIVGDFTTSITAIAKPAEV
jgi:hypothetical protein